MRTSWFLSQNGDNTNYLWKRFVGYPLSSDGYVRFWSIAGVHTLEKQPPSPNPHSSPLLLCSVWKLHASPWSPQKWLHLCKMKPHLKIQSPFATFGPGVSSFRAVSLDTEELVIFKSRKCFITNEEPATHKIDYPQDIELTTHRIKTDFQRPIPITKTTQPSRAKLS